MEVSLDHFSGHCLWSGRDQSFQNVTSKNDPVWNVANPFKFLSTVSTHRIRFSKSKVQNSIAEGFIASAPGSPHPTRPAHPTVGVDGRTGLGRRLSSSRGVGNPERSVTGSSGLPYRRAAEVALLVRQRTWGQEEARSTVPPAGLPAAPPAPPCTAAGSVLLNRASRAVLQPQAQKHLRDGTQNLLCKRYVWHAHVC